MKTRLENLTDIIIDQLGVDAGEVKLESRFVEDLGADSLDHVELVMAIEDEWDITVEDEDAERVTTVQEALALIERYAGPEAAAD